MYYGAKKIVWNINEKNIKYNDYVNTCKNRRDKGKMSVSISSEKRKETAIPWKERETDR